MKLQNLLEHRRSVRLFNDKRSIPPNDVEDCLRQATLAPTSSNMQLWQFIHLVDSSWRDGLTKACLGQKAASTATQWVVFVTRQDFFQSRAKFLLNFEILNIKRNNLKDKQTKRIAHRKVYYGKLMPLLYARFFRLLGIMRKLIVLIMGIFRPVVREVSETEIRTVVHKSCALAAQTFMLAMAEKGYDTCPMEGFDSKMVKKLLHLPRGTGINMIISCGIRDGNKGIWGDRCRVPFEEVYKRR
ncbi:MAG: nitroreductase family protein [Flavobacteriaceae bacterium]